MVDVAGVEDVELACDVVEAVVVAVVEGVLDDDELWPEPDVEDDAVPVAAPPDPGADVAPPGVVVVATGVVEVELPVVVAAFELDGFVDELVVDVGEFARRPLAASSLLICCSTEATAEAIAAGLALAPSSGSAFRRFSAASSC